jgi:co-chaperonin GroES (HSP10)
MKRILEGRVLIKVLEEGTQMEGSGMFIPDDADSLPKAVVVMVADNIDAVEEGDIVYYVKPRERGKVQHNGEEHFVVPISAIVAVD